LARVPSEVPLAAQPNVIMALTNELALTGHPATAAAPTYSLGSHADGYVPRRFRVYIVHFCDELPVRKVLYQGHQFSPGRAHVRASSKGMAERSIPRKAEWAFAEDPEITCCTYCWPVAPKCRLLLCARATSGEGGQQGGLDGQDDRTAGGVLTDPYRPYTRVRLRQAASGRLHRSAATTNTCRMLLPPRPNGRPAGVDAGRRTVSAPCFLRADRSLAAERQPTLL